MQPSEKRTIQVNVRVSEADFDLLQEAAHQLWPDAVISNGGIMLGLAKRAAREVVEETAKSGDLRKKRR